jgi:hypothetical protein
VDKNDKKLTECGENSDNDIYRNLHVPVENLYEKFTKSSGGIYGKPLDQCFRTWYTFTCEKEFGAKTYFLPRH